jgi:transaldolase / glucose-6-phosphate isomerase
VSINPLVELTKSGQSIWYDGIERGLITSGELSRLIEEYEIRGVTSNPTIFEKAIDSSDDYSDQLREQADRRKSASDIYQALVVRDIQMAADLLAPVFEKTDGSDGFVSLECSPLLARDTVRTIEEVRHLWSVVNRKNVMIKIPATSEGFPAIEQCVYEGININITLIFSLHNYKKSIEAYLRGLERRVAEHKPIDRIASVASFFVSRIDTAVDARLRERIARADSVKEKEKLECLLGRIAIANAKIAYQIFKRSYRGERFVNLGAQGARVQRPLWAATSAKNPAYPDVYYVEALIGPETVNTVPPATLKAFRDHGRVRVSLDENVAEETAILAGLEEVGIRLDDVTQQVLDDGLSLFARSFEKLMKAIRSRRDDIVTGLKNSQSVTAPDYKRIVGIDSPS